MQALHSITFGERQDRPILIKTTSEWLPNNSPAAAANSESAGLSGSTSEKTVAGPPGTVIQALQVCQNDPRDPNERELKGLRIWATKPDAQGKMPDIHGTMNGLSGHPADTIGAQEGVVSATRPNCRVWAAPVFCESNSAVVAIRAVSTTAKGFQNIGITCGRLYGSNDRVLPPVIVLPTQTMTGTFDGGKLTVIVSGAGLEAYAGDTTGSLMVYVKDVLAIGPFSLTHQSGSSPIALTSNQTTTWAALGCGPTTVCDVSGNVWEAVTGPGLRGEYKIGTIPLHITRPTAAPSRK